MKKCPKKTKQCNNSLKREKIVQKSHGIKL